MARLTRDAIVARLEGQGLRFRDVRCQTEGEYLPTDVDWNNKDTVHLNHVHTLVNDVTFVVDRDLQASVSLQKVLGVRFPLVLVHYDNQLHEQTHVVTLLAWTIVTRHQFIPLSATRTRAVTTYTVGSGRFWMLFFPLVAWSIRRNYRRLMSEDVPMRERRGRLRSWGYRFRGDDGIRDIRASLAVAADNVVLPDADGVPTPTFPAVPLASIGSEGWTYVGRSDHLGLKLRRERDRVVAYARLCPHEGADLDPVPAVDGCLTCPWHGRRLSPLAELDPGADQPVETAWHRLSVVGDQLRVEVRPQASP